MHSILIVISVINVVSALNCSCGIENVTPKIGGGYSVSPNRYPWLVIVRSRVRNGKFLNCGGSIINNRIILTAAHCLQHKLEVVSIKVTVGTNEKHENNSFVYAEKWITHEKYMPRQYINDIGIIRLRKPLDFNTTVYPICLPQRGVIANGNFVTAGWGLTETGNASKNLREISVQEYDFKECAQSWWTRTTPLNKKFQICASSEKGSSCSGDSGGPLMQRINGTYIAVGITSFGNKTIDCGQSINTVYTRVEPYLDWILDKVRTGQFCDK